MAAPSTTTERACSWSKVLMKRPRSIGEQRNRLRVLRLGAAHDNFLDAMVPAGDQIAIAEEKAARADGGHDLHVGSGLADEVGIVVFDISARADAFRACVTGPSPAEIA